ncbi:hypothetical protein F0U59_09485 [Archangium gephyra]|nr:hypothetical protein F0U59_09485 [Archangium gephyra]
MSLWDSLKRWIVPARGSTPTQRLEVAPGLTVSLSRHEVDGPRGKWVCWSYVSEGLARHGQKELVLLLRQGAAEAEPSSAARSVLEFFVTVQDFAGRGMTVDAGGITRFGKHKLLGRHLLYVTPSELPGLPMPRDALAAVLVTDAECTLIESAGPMRVMASLGQAASHYPCPPWSDLARPELPAAELWQASQLSRMPLLKLPGVRVLQAEGEIILRIAPGTEALFRKLGGEHPVAAKGGFGLITGFDSTADAWLVWEPGQSEPRAITPPGSRGTRVGGSFIALFSEQEKDSSLLVEDGFTWFLTEASWTALWRALNEGQSLALLAGEGQRLRLEWVA